MEMDAIKVLLNDLLTSGLNIGVLVTDHSTSIRKYMRECILPYSIGLTSGMFAKGKFFYLISLQ